MKRSIALLLLLALLASADLALAHGGVRGGRSGFGIAGIHGGGVGQPAGRSAQNHPPPPPAMIPGRTPMIPGRIPMIPGRTPIVTGSAFPHDSGIRVPHYYYRRMVVGGAVVLAGPLLYYYYYPPGYPVTPAPVYVEPPLYVDPADVWYYCPAYSDYYPNVTTCPTPWLEVLPDPGIDPN